MTTNELASTGLVLALALAGCAAGTVAEPGIGWVPSGEERLAVAGAATQRSVRFDDGSEIEEYGRAGIAGWRAEYLYLAADDPDLDFTGSFDVARVASLFRSNAADAPVLGELGRVGHPGNGILYRPFARPDQACFAFQGHWPSRPHDSRGQAGQLLLGYACRIGPQPLSPQEIEGLLARLRPQPAVRPDHLPALPPAADAGDFGLGRDEPGSGLVSYPLQINRHYLGADGEVL